MHIVDALNHHFIDYGSNKYRRRRTLLLEINQFLCGFDIEYVIGKRTVWIKDKNDHSLILIYSEKKKVEILLVGGSVRKFEVLSL